MKIQFESEIKKTKKLNSVLNSSVVNTDGNDTLPGLGKLAKQKLNQTVSFDIQ